MKTNLFLLFFIIANVFAAIYLYLNEAHGTDNFLVTSSTLLLAFTAAFFPIITIISFNDNEIGS